MAEHHYVERDTGSGVATGMVLAIIAVLLVGILALFVFFGGPGRFVSGSTTTNPPSNTNVNVPAPAQSQPQSAPQINVPPRVDLNVNNPSQGQPPSNSGSNSSGNNSGGTNSGGTTR